MKTKYLLFITVVIAVIAFIFWPAKYKIINNSGWNVNADSFMNTGDYYFMCKPNNGYLIKKEKPKLNISNKKIDTDNIIDSNRQEKAELFIENNPLWFDMVEYKSTNLMDTGILSSDLYTLKVSELEYLMVIDRKYRKKPTVKVLYLSFEDEKERLEREELLTYDKLVMLAQQRCREQGIDG
ncbi:hypothetical protein LZS94_07435 [Aliivibrio fischeri]|uniref:hypothetical protein n=1 Tax=Aliivibrio fischeri TaxID=668 RepID=UPI001F47E2BC|nr:hypothetical protein [Aliivibrio fischeri]MCE7577320.1 hypothetical protein [Aliivibrio fischeri]MCE7589609.1 hypothetical protein [Aliivibrio fischeri]